MRRFKLQRTVAYFNHPVPEDLPQLLIGCIAANTSIIIIHTQMERLSGLQKLVVRHRNLLAVAAKGALRTSLVELRRKKLASLWIQVGRLVEVLIALCYELRVSKLGNLSDRGVADNVVSHIRRYM
jgi:hypothetical protein